MKGAPNLRTEKQLIKAAKVTERHEEVINKEVRAVLRHLQKPTVAAKFLEASKTSDKKAMLAIIQEKTRLCTVVVENWDLCLGWKTTISIPFVGKRTVCIGISIT
jgi:hypothetical protein